MAEIDVAVVGAGVAGLAAAAAVRAAGRSAVVLEATGRIGGRARTTRPAALRGVAFDHGASWLHNAETNPLTPVARAQGVRLVSSEATRVHRTFVGNRLATPQELAAYEAAEARFHDQVGARAAGPDASLQEAAAPLLGDPWIPTVLTWESAVIAAADAHRLSLHDWAANLLEGQNLALPDGMGDFIAGALGPPAGGVRLGCPVRRIDWGGDGVALETAAGTLRARAVVVTVSTGVLAAGGIRFTPELPASHAEAIDGLAMGLLTKLAFPARGGDRLGLPHPCAIDRRVDRPGDPMPTVLLWPGGADMVVSFLGGDLAWDLARQGPGATEAHVRDWLRGMFGARVDAVLPWPAAVVTGWAADPWFRGAYAYARPGKAGGRAELARPLAGGRLCFGGEALHESLAGTVGGAYESGRRAAAAALAAL